MVRANRLLLSAALLALLSACGATRQLVNTQGYIPDEELTAAIEPGVDNKESVERTLGQPTVAAQWDDNIWYYLTRNTKQIAFARPRAKDQKVLIVRFDDKGNVASVERRGMEQVARIAPNGDKTPTLGRSDSLLGDLFGNIGQVGSMPGGPGGP